MMNVNDCYIALGLVPTATVPDMSVTSMYILTYRHMDPLVYTFIALAPGRHCSCASVLVQVSFSCVKAFPFTVVHGWDASIRLIEYTFFVAF